MRRQNLLSCIALLLIAWCVRADCSRDRFKCNPASNAGIRTLILPRSQGANTAMELVGWQDFIHQFVIPDEDKCMWGVADLRFEYTRTFDHERIAEQLFGSSVLHFEGSQVLNRRSDALIADYFGLATDFKGAICFKPRIDNFIVDLNVYFGLDSVLPGLYIEAHLPVCHTRTTLFEDCNGNFNGCFINNGNLVPLVPCATGCTEVVPVNSLTPFPGTYMNSCILTKAQTQLVNSPACTDRTAAPKVPVATNILQVLEGTFLFGDMQELWVGSRISRCALLHTALADIDVLLGWDFLKTELYHLGAFLQIVAPTGGAPCAGFIFAPLVGNGGHTEVGGGISAHIDLWGFEENYNAAIWFQGNVTHLFAKCSARTFDFKNGPLSRFMLLKELDYNDDYAGRLINGVNFTTRYVKTEIPVKGDASLKFAYNNGGFRFDIGYNIYGNSAERLPDTECKRCDTSLETLGCSTRGCDEATTCANIDNRRFSIKGCQGVAAEAFTTTANETVLGIFDVNAVPNPIPINSTESNATAFACGTPDFPEDVTILPDTIVDDVALAWNSIKDEGELLTNPLIKIAKVSDPPVHVTVANLNLCSGLAKAQITHKVFGYVGYSWLNCIYTPFLGFVWEAEWAQSKFDGPHDCQRVCATSVTDYSTECCTTSSTCRDKYGGVSSFGVGIKGGVSF